MPKQNRVTPFGQLIATAARGTLMGNRGCLHDNHQRIRRPFVGRRWIICVLEFRGRHRTVMTPGRYTELFFLDEATALSAGHRPCAECQRDRYRRFCETWGEGNPGLIVSPSRPADQIDLALHGERLDDENRKRTWLAPLSELPPGVLVADQDGHPFLVREQSLLPWEPGGYGRGVARPAGAMVRVLTPRSIANAIRKGYPVMVHPSAAGDAGGAWIARGRPTG